MHDVNDILSEHSTRTAGKLNHFKKCSVEILRTEKEFDEIEQEWIALVEESNCTVFQTYEWQRTWWKYFHRRHELKIVLFRDQQRLVGIAPMFMQYVRVLGIPVAHRLQFIGCGISDYGDMIFLPGYEHSVLEAFARHITEFVRTWDILDFEDVSEYSPVFQLLPQILRNHGLPVYRYQGNVCPRISLPESAEMLMQNIGSTTGYNFRRKFKKLQSNFKTEVTLYRTETDNLEKGIDEFSWIHGERWKSQGYPSAFDNPIHKSFHVEVVSKFAKRDWLRLFFLNADEQPVAVSFCFNYKQRIYMYQSNAFGSEAIMKCSPGFLIRSIAMVEGISEGNRIFDFLRGDEDYKYNEWRAIDTKNWLIRSSSPKFGNKGRFTFYLLLELLKKMKKRIVREYFEFVRFKLVKKPSVEMIANYVITKLAHLLRLGVFFITRHSPLESVIVGGNGATTGFDPVQSSERFHNASHQTYTLGEKIVRIFRSYKLNNIIWRIRVRFVKQQILEETSSSFSGPITITERGRERQLIIDHSTHSIFFSRGNWGEVRREYWGAMCDSPFPFRENPNILMCGLGGGTILHLLNRKIKPHSVTALEIDPEIISVARRHFALDTIPNVSVIEGNATASIRDLQNMNRKYDVILDDVFYTTTGTLTNYHRSLIKCLASLLTENGVIVFQRPIDKEEDNKQADKFVKALRDMNYLVKVKKIRRRWWNNIIYCTPKN